MINYLTRHKPRVPSQLSECSGAGTGCGWCIPYLKRFFEQHKLHAGHIPDEVLAEVNPEDYAQGRAAYIQAGKGKAAPGAEPQP